MAEAHRWFHTKNHF